MERPVQSLNRLKKERVVKKAFILGMVFVAGVSAAQISFAAQGKAPREIVVDYTKEIRQKMLGNTSATVKSLDSAKADAMKSIIIKELNMGSKTSDLNASISGEAGKARMDALLTIIAVKRSADAISKSDAVEAKSMLEAAEASVTLIANARLAGEKSSTLQGTELNLVRETLGKLESMPADIITNFSKSERDSYTAVLKKLNELANDPATKSYEDAFILAIMEVKKVDRTKALEIVKKLKECV